MLNIKTNEKLLFVSYVIVFLIFLIMRNILLVNFSPYFITIITIIYAFISKRNPLEILVFLIPFSSAIQANYIIMSLFLIYLFKYLKQICLNKNFIYLFLIILIEIVNCLNIQSSIVDFINFSIIMIFITVHFSSPSIQISRERSEKKYILGTILATLLFVIITFNYISIDHFLVYGNRLNDLSEYLPFSQYLLNFNANDLALYLLVAITLLLDLNYYKKINKVILIMSLIILFAAGILTMSRAFLLCCIIIVLYVIILSNNKIKALIQFVVFASIFIILMISIIPNFSEKIMDNFSSRFAIQDKTGGRDDLLKIYNQVIVSSPRQLLIGCGIQNYHEKNNISLAAHNALQEIVVAWGIIGFCAMLLLIINFIKGELKKVKSVKAIDVLSLLIFIIMIQSIQFFSSGMKIFLLIVVLLPIGLRNEKGVSKEHE